MTHDDHVYCDNEYERLSRAAKNLIGYTDHKADCEVMDIGVTGDGIIRQRHNAKCTCGLAELLDEVVI